MVAVGLVGSNVALKSPRLASRVEMCPRSTDCETSGDVVPPNTSGPEPVAPDSTSCTLTVHGPLYRVRSTCCVIASCDGSKPDFVSGKPALPPPHSTSLLVRSKCSPSAVALDGPDSCTVSVQLSTTGPPPVGHDAAAVIVGQFARVVTVTGPLVATADECRGAATLAVAVYCAPARMPVNVVATRSSRPSHTMVFDCGAPGPDSCRVIVAPTPPTSRMGSAPRSRSTVVVVVPPNDVLAGCDAVSVSPAAFGVVQL